MRIKKPELYDYDLNLSYMMRDSEECMFRIENNKIFKAIEIENIIYIIKISNLKNHLAINILNHENVNKDVELKIKNYVEDWLDLKYDLNTFYDFSKKDRILKNVIKQFNGLRNIGIVDLFEAMTWGILGQQINLHFAYILKKTLVQRFGKTIEYDNHIYYIYPKPEDLASHNESDFDNMKLTHSKIKYLLILSNEFVENKINKKMLIDSNNLKKAEKIMTNIKGIGPWTANYVLMRCLRFPDAFPIDDVGLQNSIKQVLKLDQKPTIEFLNKLNIKWKNFQAYATFYLWRLLY